MTVIPGPDTKGVLISFLKGHGEEPACEPITPDASNRAYYRVSWRGEKCVACVYPEPIDESLPFLDTTRLFDRAGIPVARILDTDNSAGIVIQEDLGNTSLAEALARADEGSALIDDAIRLIAQIQSATELAVEMASIASRLKFDREKLLWELNFFERHYFSSLKGIHDPEIRWPGLKAEFESLAEELERYSVVLTHRDFHAQNLMVLPGNTLALIDHQDARLGSAAYDLVSLLLDRVEVVPDESKLASGRELLIEERRLLGLQELDAEKFETEFRLVAIQRCLKAIGTFSNQAANFAGEKYLRFIDPMFRVVHQNCDRLGRFPEIRKMIEENTGI